jgi:type I restriction enzyme R subunit
MNKERIKHLLSQSGWCGDDLLEEQQVYFGGKVLSLDIVLLHNLYPFAVVSIQELEAARERVIQWAKAIEVPFAFVTDGTNILQFDIAADEVETCQKFPVPAELWSSLGREWDERDPRLFPPCRKPEITLQVHHVLAVSNAVEAVTNGERRVLLSMVRGSGSVFVALEIACKLVRSGFCNRLLYLSNRQAQVEFATHILEPFDQDLVVLNGEASAKLVQRVHLGTVSSFVAPVQGPGIQGFAPDYYDLIIVANADPISPMMPILEHFCNAAIIAFTGREPPDSEVIRFYGQPKFIYSVEETVAVRALA